jgi:hypothetical protein
MINQPKEITIAKLEVLIMPSGEILSLGQHIGWFNEENKKYLSEPKSGITGLPVKEE